MRLKLLLSYDGACYHGWQIQESSSPLPTIQSAVETALFALTGRKIRVLAAGRTDAGVHALGQVAHCDIPDAAVKSRLDWRRALNASLPGDIRILSADIARPDFHARKDAVAKTYIYDFWRDKTVVPPCCNRHAWICGRLDVDRMHRALPMFMGPHDFASFQNTGTDIKTSIRSILDISLVELPRLDYFPPHLPLLRLVITGDGFLKQMARNIAGFLVWIGKNKMDGARLGAIFAARDRKALPSPTAPAAGLALARVCYDKSDLAATDTGQNHEDYKPMK